MKHVIKKMLIHKSGSIINLATSQFLCSRKSAYASSKAALISLSEVVSREAGRNNIRVNVVSPGLTDTKMLIKSSSEK